ncbi:hypothetical protein BDR07DRAFT_176534 [Suillus spraguei]|nr:hypothetical protein BDR07DRAFT_176534 [Suillus spraguei]
MKHVDELVARLRTGREFLALANANMDINVNTNDDSSTQKAPPKPQPTTWVLLTQLFACPEYLPFVLIWVSSQVSSVHGAACALHHTELVSAITFTPLVPQGSFGHPYLRMATIVILRQYLPSLRQSHITSMQKSYIGSLGTFPVLPVKSKNGSVTCLWRMLSLSLFRWVTRWLERSEVGHVHCTFL